MTTEEKARAYDEALTTAKRIISENCSEVEKLCLKCVFPELAESEDERTRRSLIDAIKIGYSNNGISFTKEAADRYIAWLEKQKEEEGYEAIPVESTLEYKLGFKAGKDSEKQKEQKPKFNVGDTIRLKNSYAEYTIENISDGKYYCKGCSIDIDGCDRDYELVQRKPEWSEEDEEMIANIISSLHGYMCVISGNKNYNNHETYIQKEIEFLNALRPSWKPSEEQMNALKNSAYGTYQNGDGPVLRGLYEQLEKLM